MNFFDILLAKKLEGGGGAGKNYALKGEFKEGTTSAIKTAINVELLTPSNITSIANNGFYPTDYELKKAILSEVTAIGTQAFYNSTLEEVQMPKIVTIGVSAFYNCKKLIEIDLPNSIENIGSSAFRYCIGLKTIYCRATTPPICGSNILNGATSLLNIYVPAESVDAYKAASEWSNYASYIKAIPEE